MALTESNMMELGTPAPDFSLRDTKTGKAVGLQDRPAPTATVVMFICNHCPYVHHFNSALVKLANAYPSEQVRFIAISSNDVENYPQDAPPLMAEVAEKEGYPFPYLYDETQETAKAYGAECTPDFFVFNKNLNCAYRGRFDESRPGTGKATGCDLAAAIDALIAGRPVDHIQYPSMGCGIKWK